MGRRYGKFIWDTAKEAANALKHGIDFTTAAKAFLDPKRKIFTDSAHSGGEPRYFCIGMVRGRIMTVRFTYREGLIRIIGAGWWRRGGLIMKRNDRDADMPVGRLARIKDTLPPPEELMAGEKTVKVTLRLSESSIKFFKQYAHKYHTKYQKVIRRLVDVYAERFA